MADKADRRGGETRLGMTYEQFVRKYLENDPYEFMAHIDAIWASLPVDEKGAES
ncbi:MAG: hypothetical protein J6M64_07660 [Oscillospiraceae bacterium]|nr:hypothetical protein [Oscillospiraceae bacterium]